LNVVIAPAALDDLVSSPRIYHHARKPIAERTR
jgi:hypothetical protein